MAEGSTERHDRKLIKQLERESGRSVLVKNAPGVRRATWSIMVVEHISEACSQY